MQQDYMVTFQARGLGTTSYIMTGFASKALAVSAATSICQYENGSAYRLKKAEVYVGKTYVCQGR